MELKPSSVTGILKGFDALMNLVLDNTEEVLRDPEDSSLIWKGHPPRELGLVVCRGTSIVMVNPDHGVEEIANPFQPPPTNLPSSAK